MAWIESHQDLEEHPKILMLCNKTGWNLDEAIGKLHRLWWWALKYAEDGDLSKYEPSQFLVRLNSKLAPEKLYEVLQKANFIEKNGLLHDWLDYAGRYLTSKYRTANPKKLKEIFKKHKTAFSQTKDRLKSDNQDNLPNLNNQDKKKPQISDSEFIQSLKTNPAYKGIDIDRELGKMDAWLLTSKGKGRQKTRRFILTWLNRIDKPVVTQPKPEPKPDPNCDICRVDGKATGRIPEGPHKGAQCLCVK